MLARNGRVTLVAGAALYVAAWGFGTAVMYPIAIGLVLAPLLAYAWVRVLARPMLLRRTLGSHELIEGGTVPIGLEVRVDGGPLPSQATMLDRLGERQVLETALVRRGHVLRGQHVLREAPRGRYRLHHPRVLVSDPFWLAEAEIPIDRTDTVVVYPQVFALDNLFTDAGSAGGDVSRTLLHRASGYDLHSIRDFQHGESLRRVHWRSTAKRRRLMVKELQDTPRDEAAVLLDADPAGEVPAPGGSSFDVAVRSAASILGRLVESGQRCSLVIHAETRIQVRVGSGAGDWPAALAELATVRATAPRPLAAMIADSMGGGEPIDAARVYVVSCNLTPALAEALLQLRSARRDLALVWVDAATFAGNTAPAGSTQASLRLGRAGVALARVQCGEDLSRALSAASVRMAANA